MTSWGSRFLLACWVLAGEFLSAPVPWAAELVEPSAAATATHQQHRRRVQLFVAGGEVDRVQSASSSTEGETAPGCVIAHAIARGRELLLEGSLHEAAEVLQGVLASKQDEPGALLHLAEVLAQLGQPHRAVMLANRLLGLERLTPEARSFMLNRRGLYMTSANDWGGARESYELALETGGQEQGINRHALWNLASLLHFHIFPSETVGPNFSTLQRAIELYRVALGRNGTTTQTALDSNPQRPESGSKEHDIGGPVDRYSIVRDLAAALLLAGRPGEAVVELEYALTELTASTENSNSHLTSEQFNSEDGHQVAAKPTADRATAATTSRIGIAFLLDSLAGARRAAGDVPGALAAGKLALSLVNDEPGLYHNMALLLQKAGQLNEAQDAWLSAVALDSGFAPAFAGLGHLEGARGNIGRARQYYEASLAATRSQGPRDANGKGDGGHYYVRYGDEELTSLFLVATAVVPALYESNDHVAQVRRDFERGLDRLLAEPMGVFLKGTESPSATVGSGALGYYIIYQGFEDLDIRRKLARAYWRFAPSLRYSAPFLANGSTSSAGGQHDKNEVHLASKRGSSPLGNLGEHSFDSLHSDTTTGEVEPMLPPTKAESPSPPPLEKPAPMNSPANAEDLFAGTAHGPSKETSIRNNDVEFPCRQRRIKVGFLSAFFFHHSVGLLVEGVVTRLDRRRFETTAIFVQPHPTSASSASPGKDVGDRASTEGKRGSVGDDVYNAVRTGTEHVLDLPVNSLAASRHAIASLQLDVLVFTEIGMNFEAYFLSFAQLARRSVLFWGHAVTSGVGAFDALRSRNSGTRDVGRRTGEVEGGGLESSEIGELEDATHWSEDGGAINDPHRVGGIDYFVSSWLFEEKSLGRLAQRKYSESLYLMEGLTTRFSRPPPPKPAVVTRETLGIPRRPLLRTARHLSGGGGVQDDDIAEITASDGERHSLPPSCGALYLVPQTLYKLHPDFDHLVAGVLRADLSGCAVFIKALEAPTTEGLVRRMSRALLAAGVATERIIFVPRMGLGEFSGLVEMADVVLDTFPVGGGRSSFEIFAVGTPIVMLYSRTSILQLTYGMYDTMGLEGAIRNATDPNTSVSLVTYNEDQFVRSAVAVATDADLNARTRELILANNHRLFEQDSVVTEWEGFLEGIVSVPRPPPTERNLGLAVDASDFPRKVPWCRSRSSNGISRDGDEGNIDFEKVRGGDRTHQERTTVYPQTSHSDALVVRPRLRQEARAPLPPMAGSNSGTEPGGDGYKVSQKGIDDTAYTSERNATTGASMNTEKREDSTMPAASASAEAGEGKEAEVAVAAGSVDENYGGGIQRESELLYAINFSVAPPHAGDEPMQLSAEVYEGMDPMEEATRLRRDGALDYLQYRWIGTVLCRGVGRLKRPVVWSTYVKIDGGPRALLEVRHGDDLYQVARWHCHRNSLGAERVPVLVTSLEKELPQHTDPEWVSSRAEDGQCSTPAASGEPPYSPSYPISLGSENSNAHGGSKLLSADSNRAEAVAGAPGEREQSAADDAHTKSRHEADGAEDGARGREEECVTLAITTCKRLRAFLGTAEGLQGLLGPLPQGSAGGAAFPRVCQVLVVDDGSSPKDRGVMLSSFPRFTFVFKGPEDVKGHAGSMNIILSLTKTRYLLYIEDDWWAVHDNPLLPGAGNFLWRAMEILTKSTEGVSQVLVNDQSTRDCAWGDTALCTPEVHGKFAGWPRATAGSLAGQEHWTEGLSNLTTRHSEGCPSSGVGGTGYCGSGGARESSFSDGIDTGHPTVKDDSDTHVEYRLHEFGLLSPLQGFTHWPGFSLNPALWDLARLDTSYRRRYGRQLTFNSTDIRFEQSISMELLDAGVAVAHLPDVTFRHVGAGQSAYEANDMRRPWD